MPKQLKEQMVPAQEEMDPGEQGRSQQCKNVLTGTKLEEQSHDKTIKGKGNTTY